MKNPAAKKPARTPAHPVEPGAWVVYLLRCGDGTLYAGITNRLEARLHAHRTGRGARYTRGRGPLEVFYTEPAASRGDATRREAAIRRLDRAAKLMLGQSRQPRAT